MNKQQTSCRRCGNCCLNGGAALHTQDLELVVSGKIPRTSLITIRKGEPVRHPLGEQLQVARVELVKLVGSGSEWRCVYYDREQGCSIYDVRPYACRRLQCWNLEDLLDIIEKDTLTRIDLLAVDDPFVEEIERHEKLCSLVLLASLFTTDGSPDKELRESLGNLVAVDLGFRQEVLARHRLTVQQELFYFGRPVFQLLAQFMVTVTESATGISLDWSRWRSPNRMSL